MAQGLWATRDLPTVLGHTHLSSVHPGWAGRAWEAAAQPPELTDEETKARLVT